MREKLGVGPAARIPFSAAPARRGMRALGWLPDLRPMLNQAPRCLRNTGAGAGGKGAAAARDGGGGGGIAGTYSSTHSRISPPSSAIKFSGMQVAVVYLRGSTGPPAPAPARTHAARGWSVWSARTSLRNASHPQPWQPSVSKGRVGRHAGGCQVKTDIAALPAPVAERASKRVRERARVDGAAVGIGAAGAARTPLARGGRALG